MLLPAPCLPTLPIICCAWSTLHIVLGPRKAICALARLRPVLIVDVLKTAVNLAMPGAFVICLMMMSFGSMRVSPTSCLLPRMFAWWM